MSALDHSGTRKLGYRASGLFTAPGQFIFESQPQVHDENRDVWTTMNLTDRPDIREQMRSKVIYATKKMIANGEDTFEYEKL